MARPRTAPDERRDARCPSPRLTPAELLFVDSQARVAGLGLADFVRRRVLGARIKPARPVADAQAVLALNRVGVLLNQIARALYSDRPPQGDLAAALSDLRDVLARIVPADPAER